MGIIISIFYKQCYPLQCQDKQRKQSHKKRCEDNQSSPRSSFRLWISPRTQGAETMGRCVLKRFSRVNKLKENVSPWGWKLQNRHFLSFHLSLLLSSPISSGSWKNHQGDLSGKQRPTCFSPLLIMSWFHQSLAHLERLMGSSDPQGFLLCNVLSKVSRTMTSWEKCLSCVA